MAELVALGIPMAIPIALLKYGYDKFIYKKLKKSIYSGLLESLENLDFEDIVKYYDLLKDFDNKQFDKINNRVRKKLFEKLTCKPRLLKQDKTEKLFNIAKEVIEDPEKLKQWINKQNLERQKKEHNTLIEKELSLIEEKEEKQNQAAIEIIEELNVIKSKRLHQLALLRKMIDETNLTTILEEIHKDYETTIKNKVGKDYTFQKNLVLSKRKEQLKKKQEKLARISEMESGGI